MSGRYFFRGLFFLSLMGVALAVPLAADDKAPGKGPIVITSSTLVADNRRGSALFEGSVAAKSGDMTLLAERMRVVYSPDGGIMTIEAEGGVKLTRGGHVVVAGRAVYQAGLRKITFTDNPRAMEGGNVLTGSRMVYIMDEDRFIVEGGRVYIERDRGEKD